jgi:hypothetical protein
LPDLQRRRRAAAAVEPARARSIIGDLDNGIIGDLADGTVAQAAPKISQEINMCSYIVKKAALAGSAKGPKGWMTIDTANIYYDHPYHAPFDHALNIDFVNEANGGRERVAVELSASAARELVRQILEALETGEKEHGLAGIAADDDTPAYMT